MKSHLHPAYWGSLLGLVVGSLIAFSVFVGDYESPVSLQGNTAEFRIVGLTLAAIAVVLSCIRHYLAASTDAYTGFKPGFEKLKTPIRGLFFLVVLSIIATCSLNLAVFSVFGPFSAIFLSSLVCFISLIMCGLIFVARIHSQADIGTAPPSFVITDLVMLGLLGTVQVVTQTEIIPTDNYEKIFLMGGSSALIGYFFLNELMRVFREPVRKQLREVKLKYLK